MSTGTLNYAPAPGFDTGRFAARWLQVMATVQCLWMIVDLICFGKLTLDFAPIFWFLIAGGLKRHSTFARVAFLYIAGFCFILCAYAPLHAIWFGTQHMTVSFGRRIHNPALWQVALICGAIAAVMVVPFVVLLTERAKQQFSS